MDFHGFSFDVISNGITDKFCNEIFNIITFFYLFFHLSDHFLSNEFGLGVGGVRGLSNLFRFSVGVTDAEKSKIISVFSFNVSEGFD